MLHCMYITYLVNYTRWTEYLTRLAEKRDAYGALVGRLGGKRPFGRLKRKWKDNSKWTLKKEYSEGARSELLCVSTCASGGLIMNCRFPRKAQITSCASLQLAGTWLSDDVCDLLRSVLLDWLLSVSDSSNSSHLLSFRSPMICSCSLRRLSVSGDQTSGSGSSSGVVAAPPSCPFIHWARCKALPLLAPDLPSWRHLCSIRSSKCRWEVPRDLHSGIGVCKWNKVKHY